MEKFGNNKEYTSNIDGQDISDYDDTTKELYKNIKSVENINATYGSGIFLISSEKCNIESTPIINYWGQKSYKGSGKYANALDDCYGFKSKYKVWLGTTYENNEVWCNESCYNDSRFNPYSQNSNNIVAPAFNIDLTKITLNGTNISVK